MVFFLTQNMELGPSAEEVFIMLAGEAEYFRGTENYHVKNVGEYSYHPSGMRHATKTNHLAFMSVYI